MTESPRAGTEPPAASSPTQARRPQRYGWWLAGRLALVVALVGGVVGLLDRARLSEVLAKVSLGPVLAYIGLAFVAMAIISLRWLLITRRLGLPGLSLGYLFRTALLAEFANIWFPSVIAGEGLRLARLVGKGGHAAQATASIVLDRLVGLGALMLWCLPWVPTAWAHRDRIPISPLTLVLAGLVVLGAIGAALVVLRRLPNWWSSVTDALRLLRSPRQLAVPALLSVSNFAVIYAGSYILLRELADATVGDVGLVAVVSRLGRMVPVSILGIGGVEGLTYALGELVGLAAEAVALFLAFNVVSKYTIGAAGALWELAAQGRSAFMR